MKKNKANQNNTAQIKALITKSAPKSQELKYGEGDNELVVQVYPVLSFTKRTEMVNEIVDGVFMGGKNVIKDYSPEFLTLLQKLSVIKYFTDLSLPTKLDDMWLVLNYTTVYDDVIDIVGKGEIEDIFEAANKSIEAFNRYLARKTDINSMMSKVSESVGNFEKRIPQEDIIALVSKVKDITKGTSWKDIVGALFKNTDV